MTNPLTARLQTQSFKPLQMQPARFHLAAIWLPSGCRAMPRQVMLLGWVSWVLGGLGLAARDRERSVCVWSCAASPPEPVRMRQRRRRPRPATP